MSCIDEHSYLTLCHLLSDQIALSLPLARCIRDMDVSVGWGTANGTFLDHRLDKTWS